MEKQLEDLNDTLDVLSIKLDKLITLLGDATLTQALTTNGATNGDGTQINEPEWMQREAKADPLLDKFLQP